MSVYVAADPMLCQRAEARQITEQPLGPAGKRMLMTREENNAKSQSRQGFGCALLNATRIFRALAPLRLLFRISH